MTSEAIRRWQAYIVAWALCSVVFALISAWWLPVLAYAFTTMACLKLLAFFAGEWLIRRAKESVDGR